jgi:hypothetical protein
VENAIFIVISQGAVAVVVWKDKIEELGSTAEMRLGLV